MAIETSRPDASSPSGLADGGRVASVTRGRLRVRLDRPLRGRELIERAGAHLGAQPGVRGVRTNPAAGSITVHYDPDARSAADVLAMLADVGLIVREVLAAADDGLPGSGRSLVTGSLVTALDDLDRRVAQATGYKVDLKLLFPAALGVLGVRQVLTQGLGLTQVPGYLLLWFAFDAFHKLHTAPSVEATTTVVAAGPAAPGRD